MNVLILTGNLTKDPELRRTQSGVSVVSGTIAVTRAFKDAKSGEKITDFIDFVAWDKKADYLNTYATKGDKLEISGRLESRKFTDRNNQERTAWECIVENVTCFSKPKVEQTQPTQPTQKTEEPKPDNYDDLPF